MQDRLQDLTATTMTFLVALGFEGDSHSLVALIHLESASERTDIQCRPRCHIISILHAHV